MTASRWWVSSVRTPVATVTPVAAVSPIACLRHWPPARVAARRSRTVPVTRPRAMSTCAARNATLATCAPAVAWDGGPVGLTAMPSRNAPMTAEALAVPPGLGARALPWHLWLWDPYWILGGLLFLVVACRRPRSRDDRTHCRGCCRSATAADRVAQTTDRWCRAEPDGQRPAAPRTR
jgi:hypothetical protein